MVHGRQLHPLRHDHGLPRLTERVLVTGAAGILGRHLVSALAAAGPTPIAAGHHAEFPVDLRVPELVAALFAETAPDAVIHLAASPPPASRGDAPAELATENVVHPFLNVLELAGPRRVILGSTALVYGRAPPVEGGPLRPTDLYAASRASAEALGVRRAAVRGTPLVRVRPFLVLGPGLSPGSEVGNWLAQSARGASEITTKNLDRERDVLSVSDAVAGFCVLLLHGAPGAVYNLASGTTLPLNAIFSAVCPGAAAVAAGVSTEPPVLSGEATGLRALGWAPRVSVADTLASVSLARRERRR